MNTESTHDPAEAQAPVAIDWPRLTEAVVWAQPKRLGRRWELRAGDRLAARLEWRGPWKRGYVLNTAAGERRIDEGFWGKHSVYAGGEAPVAVAGRSGFLTVKIRRGGAPGEAGSETLVWRRSGWLGFDHTLENDEGFPLVRVHRKVGLLRNSADVAIEEAGCRLPDLVELLALTWALTLAEQRTHAH